MKKLSAIMAAALVAVSIAGCGKGTADKIDYEKEEKTEEVSTLDENSITASEIKPERDLAVKEASKDPKKYVTLANYKKIVDVPEEDRTVSDDAVEQSLQEYVNAYSEYYSEHVDGTVEADSKVGIEYTLSDEVNGTQTTPEQVIYMDMDELFPGLKDALLGKNTGDEFSLTFNYPDTWWQQEVVGKEATMSGKILYLIGDPLYSEMSDDFVEEITGGQYKTVDEFREVQKNSLESYNKMNYGYSAMMKLIEDSEFSPDIDGLIANERAQIIEDYTYTQEGESEPQAPDYESFGFTSQEEFEAWLDNMAETNVKQTVVVYALADELGITVTEEDMKEYSLQAGLEYGDNSEAGASLVEDSYTQYILLSEKVTSALYELQL